MSSTTRLPADFTSLYRLFLRATGASVLNKAYPTQRLRRLWRPSFESAARVVHRLQGASLEEGERGYLRKWYSVWETRMDGTLTILSISARTRGLPHRITRNLSHLASTYDLYGSYNPDEPLPVSWRPDLPPDSPQYAPRSIDPSSHHRPIKKRVHDIDLRIKLNKEVWSAFGEVIKMAEARDGLSLGRIKPKQRRY
ncbi:hypothetical protein C8Q72DRAFT_810367, partial [Fomitopsis betulina]